MKVWSYDWERIARTATEIHLVGILFSYCILIFGPLAALFYFPSVQFSHSGGSKRLQETKCSSWTHCCPFQSSRKALTFSCAGAPNANSMLAGPPGKTHMCVLHTAFVFLFFSPYSLTNIYECANMCCSAPQSIWPADAHTYLHVLTVSPILCWQLAMWRPCVSSAGTNSAVAETVQHCLWHTCLRIDTLVCTFQCGVIG